MTYIGLENGVTGTIAILDGDTSIFLETPVFESLGYQKSKVRHINRIDTVKLEELFSKYDPMATRVVIERPMINAMRFPLIVLVVLAHSLGFGNIDVFSETPGWNVYHFFSEMISHNFGAIAVPWFYVFSGYLFFRNMKNYWMFEPKEQGHNIRNNVYSQQIG